MQSTQGSPSRPADSTIDWKSLENILLAISIGTWLLVLAVTITTVRKLGFGIWASTARPSRPSIYEDQDGQATILSSQRASKKGLRLTILAITVLGVLTSVIRMATDSFSTKSKFIDSIEIGLWVRMDPQDI